MKPLVYLAGPFTYPDCIENTHVAMKFANDIYDTNVALPFTPHLSMFEHFLRPKPISYWYDRDIEYLEHCQGLIRMPGISVGADNEVSWCKENDLPYYLLKKLEITDELQKWLVDL